jgi:hypothetical protein
LLSWSLKKLKKINSIRAPYAKSEANNCTGCFKENIGRSEWFETSCGVRKESFLSLILFYAMMGEIVSNVKGENRKPDMETLIFADDVLIRGKDKGN